MHTHRSQPGGYVILDVVVSLTVVFGIAVLLTMGTLRQQQASEALAGQREAVRHLETWMTRFQVPAEVIPIGEDPRFLIDVLPDDWPEEGWVWVRLRIAAGRRDTSLIGLVYQEAIKRFRSPPTPAPGSGDTEDNGP